ncbi:hypothetical protein [Clostridium baratii]|uniref:hypothetical protein n=1 Tax=Clostridium baratii TaxID=1561 RepID=UPI0030CD1202
MNKSKDKEIRELISKLANESKLDNEKLDEYKVKFGEIYSNNYRHEYSNVAKVLYSIKNDESRGFLTEKVKAIGNEIEDEEIKKSVLKLWDHINLENIRLVELKRISDDANKAFTQVNEVKEKYVELEKQWSNINKQANDVNGKLKQMYKDIDNSNSKSITILGIFSGIVMAFTGGLSFIASSLQNMNQVSVYRLVLVITLLSVGIFNSIFMLMYMIGKLTGLYMGWECNCENKKRGCSKKRIRCVVVRYPLVVWFNIVSTIIITTIIFMSFIDRFNLITKLLKYDIAGILIMMISTCIYIVVLVVIIKKISNIECIYEHVEALNPIRSISRMYGEGFYRIKNKYREEYEEEEDDEEEFS